MPQKISAPTKRKRRHRYRTLPKSRRKPFILQDRDIDIARVVHEHYQLNSHHIRALIKSMNVPEGRVQWNEKKITERLPQLRDEGILEKIRSDYDFTNALHRPDCYQLGPTGETLLRARGLLNESRAKAVAKNREGQFTSLPHRIMINDIWVSVQVAAVAHPDIRLIRPAEIIAAAPAATRAKDNPFEIPSHARYRHPRSGAEHSVATGVIPDKLFGLENRKTGRQLFIMLECHRSVPLTDANPARKTVLKTLAAYRRINAKPAQAGGEPIYRQHFGIPNMVVLWATTSQQKADNILGLIDHLTDGKGSGLFGVACLPMHADQHRAARPDSRILVQKWIRYIRAEFQILELLQS